MKNMSVSKQSSILIRIPETEKQQLTDLFDGLGMTITQSIYMFFKASLNNQGLPFDVKKNITQPQIGFNKERALATLKRVRGIVPNKEVKRAGINSEEDIVKLVKESRREL
jgi:addiction module RelB/DinJ family antitoxin